MKGNSIICGMVNKELFKKPLVSRVTELWKQVYRNRYKRDASAMCFCSKKPRELKSPNRRRSRQLSCP